MRATVVIPTYNRKEILLSTFDFWKKQTVKDFEIIIIDDNSTDGTSQAIEKYVSESGDLNIRVIRNERTMGSADGRNKGALYSNSDIIIYTDDDAYPSNKFIETHVLYHTRFRNAIVRGPIINFSDYSRLDFFFEKAVRDKNFLILRGYSGNYFCTANVSIRKELIFKTGLFNLEFNRWQDAEFGYRLRKLGIRRFFDFNAWVLHYKTPHQDPFKHYYNEGKYAAKLVKYHPCMSTFLRTGFIPNYPLWKLIQLLDINSIKEFLPQGWYNKLAYIKGFCEEYRTK
ncbi:MAG: glycosyltransferase family 2 protein [bacterium]